MAYAFNDDKSKNDLSDVVRETINNPVLRRSDLTLANLPITISDQPPASTGTPNTLYIQIIN